ncbi:hypothetical protein AN664_0214505 [Serratia marcescens]|nr:hypothetical protein AN701_0215245 [Serratia marcescens]OCN20823.1 hypothetical protein AN699_0214735 [Serratia marcescens]OCN41837.1 hypothetical protein AN658_0214590 [Serratia marcescens]OCN44193.1 hypothetical protein AN660_0214410 [Serratia marcescens]OCN63897.1 hypothetical protein AN664_0214505 [Serratia marcescens]
MNNNDRPTIQHFDDFPFTGGASAEIGNLVVCGRTGAGKTTLMQSIVDKYSADAVRQGISIAPTPPSEDEAKS